MTNSDRDVSRRRLLAAVGGTMAAASAAGCTEYIPFVGDEPMSFAASQAWVPEAALDETGYEEHEVDELVFEETFEAAGQTQAVEVTNWLAEYDRSIDLGLLNSLTGDAQAAIFVVLSTPQVDVLGRTFNPVGDKDADELLELVQEHYDGLGDPTRVGETESQLAGETTTVVEYETEAELVAEGMTVDLTLQVAEAVEAGDDFLIAIGGYPTELGEDEAEKIRSMAAAVEFED